MMAPFYKFGMFGPEGGLIIAFAIGIGFGFFLEKAGFGSAKKLAAQFYFTDLTVFKVMFTAIVTAMLGLFFLSAVGFVDIDLVYTGDTYLMPQIVGGLILGFGFVVGGYCPGTSVVACASGKIDAVWFIGGVFLGIIVFGEMFPLVEGFFNSGAMGRTLIYEYFNLSYGLVVFLVVLAALGGFLGAEWLEKTIGYKKKGGA
ncbi:MAG: YeeE/YedE thiosulfate transporter family protein [Candidatus Kapabacteria bacterium]|nr:YeeE/YedE thiosulfate transporter family protein [Candidatus Kapabacteria bacterium]